MSKANETFLYHDNKKVRVSVSLTEQVLRQIDDMAMGVNRSRSQMIDLLLMDRFFDQVDEGDPILDELVPGEFVRVGHSILGVAKRD
jgi:hypothetical protein